MTATINSARRIVAVCIFLSFFFHSFSQNTFRVTGKIHDNNNQPVEGATVQEKGTTNRSLTNPDGTFAINVASGNAVLVITSVGFAEQEVPVKNLGTLNVSLAPTTGSMENIVVIGYGSRKRVEVTGATTSISGENLRTVQTTNLTQALQGRLAGVEVTPSGFRPGTGASVRIRGNRSLSAINEPLYVVDGFPVSYTIDDMNPADIESIDILKDAAATAIYGVRGANGVVQITTRKGKVGKVSVNYQGTQSVETILRHVPVFNGPQITDAWRQAFFADTAYTRTIARRSATNQLYYYPDALTDLALFKNRFGSNEQWNSVKDAYTWVVYDPVNNIYIPQKRATTADEKTILQNLNALYRSSMRIDSIDLYDPSKVKSYDWADNVGLRRGSTTNHNISVTAGSEKVRASFSAGYFKQTGIEYAQDYTRYAIGSSVEFRPATFLTFGTSVNYNHTITNTSTSSYSNTFGMIPLVEPFDSLGNFVLFPNKDQQVINAVNDRNTVFDNTKANRIFGNVFAEIGLFKGLRFRTMFGLDSRTSLRGTFNGALSSIRLGSAANAAQTNTTSTSWVYDNILTYNTKIRSNHSINVTLLQEAQSLNRTSAITSSANNLIFESQKWYSLNRNTDAVVTTTGSYSAAQYLSYMGRLEYGFKNKYLLTVSNRYDKSSVLAENAEGAWFPAVSVAWQIDREDFFANQSVFSSARLRGGIGTVGNASIQPYLTGGPLLFTNYSWQNGQAAIGSAPTTFKKDVKWEKTTTRNIGVEFSMLKNRILGSVDVYSTSTTDQLQTKTIPAANGVTNILVNLGEVRNKGVEVSLTTQNINKGAFRWSTDFVFSKNKERIVDIDGSNNSDFVNLWLLDQPLQVYWGYKKEGIFQYSDTGSKGVLGGYYWVKNGRNNVNYQPGKIRVADANGDSTMSPADRVVLGSHNPTFTGSIGNTFSFKNFDLNFLVYFRVGGLYRVPRPGLVGRYQSYAVNYWTPTNPTNDYQQPTQTSDIPFGWEALTYTKATFAKVKNITLAYRVPTKLTQRAHINNFTVYVSAVNPILFHGYSKYDPETVPYREFPGSTTSNTGPTSFSYRSYILGVKLDL